jgi:predicted acyl esterase
MTSLSTHPAAPRPEYMTIDWDVPIAMDDGVVLRADVFRPRAPGTYPVLMTYGPYAKGLPFQHGYPSAWEKMVAEHPDVAAGSTNAFQNWEVVDPEKWVAHDYACVRVDARGCGRSPGTVDLFSARETRDFHDCIEWAAEQPWCSGKVGLNGISYYAMNQWLVAATQPPHLAALCIWEGASDWYRELTHHGGILCTFVEHWYEMQVNTVQYGLGARGPVNPNTGAPACGDETLDNATLAANRTDYPGEIRESPLAGAPFYRERTVDFSKVTVPLLSAGNWGGQGLHLRGNVEGFLRAASTRKWLELHGLEHWTHFYTDYGVDLQRRFFDHFLKGEDNGWTDEPPVQLQVRHVDGSFVRRAEQAWPLSRTRWTRLELDASSGALTDVALAPAEATFDARGDGLTFSTPPLEAETEITGPVAARLFVSSTTTDADLFLILRVFGPDGEEVVFTGAIDPFTAVGKGWLRASLRKLDPAQSLPYRPYHAFDESQPLEPGAVYELEIELWPTCLVVPAGYRIALTVQGRDYEYSGATPSRLSNFKNELRGCGPFLHDDEVDRPADVFGGRTTVYTGGGHDSSLLLPVIPV